MTKVNFNTLAQANDEATIEAAIDSVHRRADSIQIDLHRILVAICERWLASGDVRPAVRHVNRILAKGKLQGVRTNAIREWVETFMGFVVIAEGDDKGLFAKGTMKATGMNMKELTNKRWFEFKPEAPYKPLDFDKMFKQLMDKASKRAPVATDEDNVDPELLALLQKAHSEYVESKAAR